MSVTKISNLDISKLDKDIKFVLDTNIIYFVHSGYYNASNQKSKAYSNFIQNLLQQHKTVVVSSLSLQELLFGIENKEYLLYLDRNGIKKEKYSKKDFRKDAGERKRIQRKINTIWNEINNTYTLLDSEITNLHIQQFINLFDSHRYDPIDYILTQNYLPKDYVIITDDADFQVDPNVNIITA